MKTLMLLCALSSLAMGQHDYEDGWAVLDWYVDSPDSLHFEFDVSGAPAIGDKIFYIFLEYPGQEDVYQILAVTVYDEGHDQYGTGTLGPDGTLSHDADSTLTGGVNNLRHDDDVSSSLICFRIPLVSNDPYDFPIECGAIYNIRCGYSNYPEGWSAPLMPASWTMEDTIVVPYPYSLTPTTWASIKTSF